MHLFGLCPILQRSYSPQGISEFSVKDLIKSPLEDMLNLTSKNQQSFKFDIFTYCMTQKCKFNLKQKRTGEKNKNFAAINKVVCYLFTYKNNKFILLYLEK